MSHACAACVSLLLAVSVATVVSAGSLEAEEWLEAVARVEKVVPVNDSAGLYAALQTAEDVVVLLQSELQQKKQQQSAPARWASNWQAWLHVFADDIDFSNAWWAPGVPITIAANQTVMLRGGQLQSWCTPCQACP